MWQKAMNKSNK